MRKIKFSLAKNKRPPTFLKKSVKSRKQIGGSQALEFYDPRKCTKEHKLRKKYGPFDTLASIFYEWSDPECYLIDMIMYEALLGSSMLKSRRKYFFPFHTSVKPETIRVAFRIAKAAHFSLLFSHNKSKCPTQKSLEHWSEWLQLLTKLIKIMTTQKLSSINVGYV